MQILAARITASNLFNHTITAMIIVNAVIIGLDTSPEIRAQWGDLFSLINNIILMLFIIEALLKMLALFPSPHHYFRDGWNLFDFSVIVVSLMPWSGPLATLARLARLLRVLRLVSALPELRLIVATLIRSIPSMGNVIVLMSIIFYVYGVAGYHFFHEADPTHWHNLGISLLTLFRIVTLEDWTDVMYAAMAVYPMAWLYFVSFVVLGTFVVVNLFIAVVINNLDEAKAERLRELQQTPDREMLMNELKATQEQLQRLTQMLTEPQHPEDKQTTRF